MNKLKTILKSKLTQWILAAMVVGLIAKTFMGSLLPGLTLLPDFSSPWFSLALVLAIGYRIVNAYGWALVLRSMGQNVDGVAASRIWLVAESRRWLPGGVWGYTSRAVQANQLGVSPKIASASMLVELMITLAAAIMLFLPVVFWYGADCFSLLESVVSPSSFFWLVTLVPMGTGLLLYVTRKKLLRKIEQLKQRVALLQDLKLDAPRLVKALVFYLLMGVLNGSVTCCLIASMPLVNHPPALAVIACTSFAWVIGFVAVFAPGGMVVREATFATCIGFWTPYPTAMAIAVLTRVVQLLAEVVGMGVTCFNEGQTADGAVSDPTPQTSVGL